MADFNQAIKWLKEGKKVRRSSWDKSHISVDSDWNEGCSFDLMDVDSTDWEIYCEEHDWVNEHKLSCRPMHRRCGILGCNIKICSNCGIEKPEVELKTLKDLKTDWLKSTKEQGKGWEFINVKRLKQEAIKEYILLKDHYKSCEIFPKEIRLLSDQNRKLLQSYIKWKNNITEEDLK